MVDYEGRRRPVGLLQQSKAPKFNFEPASLQAAAATAVEDSMHFNYS